MPTCVIRGCRNRPEIAQRDKSCKITFHRFPVKFPNIMKLWLRAIGPDNLKEHIKVIHHTSIICSEHFEEECLTYVGPRRRLDPAAVPTIFADPRPVTRPDGKWKFVSEVEEIETVVTQQCIPPPPPQAETYFEPDVETHSIGIEIVSQIAELAELTTEFEIPKADMSVTISTAPLPEEDNSLACLSPDELAQQMISVPPIMPMMSIVKENETFLKPNLEVLTPKVKLAIPSICHDALRSGTGVAAGQTCTEVVASTSQSSSESPTLEKVVVLRAKARSDDLIGQKKAKFPRKIPAKMIKGGKKLNQKSKIPFVKEMQSWPVKQAEEYVCVTDLSSVFSPSSLDKDMRCGTLETSKLCRLCAQADQRSMTAIFGHQGKRLKLEQKIQRFLTIEVCETDRLPLSICGTCVAKLNVCQDLADSSEEAETKLRMLVDAEDIRIEVKEMLMAKNPRPRVQEATTVNEPKKYFCKDCDKKFDDFTRYFRHSYTIHKKKKCKSCEELFETKEELFEHRREEHGYQCDCCGLKFCGINDLLSHLRKEHPDFKNFTCDLCGKSFNSKYALATHNESHRTDQPFLCDTCGRNFKSRRKLKAHKCASGIVEVLPPDNNCALCEKSYSLRSSLKRHMLRHRGERKYECHVCQKRFYDGVHLKNHLVIHEKHTLYECPFCCARYFHKRNMIAHLRDKHSVPWNYKCPSCDEIFQSIDDTVRHSQTHIENVPLGLDDQTETSCFDFKCKICFKLFENVYSLGYHFEEHVIRNDEDLNIKSMETDGIYECNICGEKLVSNWTMKKHMRKFHSLGLEQAELLYECDTCSKRFASKSQLKYHISQHTGQKPYSCQYCTASFRTHQAAKIHIRLHTNETPYHCKKCPKQFRSASTLKIHQSTHEKPFTCQHCGQKFPNKISYFKHTALHTSGGQEALQVDGRSSKRNVIHKCKNCDFVCKTKGALKKHEVVHETNSDVAYFNL